MISIMQPHDLRHSSTQCSLLDLLPPEIRMRIFAEVLRSDFSLLLANEDYPNEVRLNTSLLRTNKSIYQEASEALFKTNKILLWKPSELRHPLRTDQQWMYFVQHLELVNVEVYDYWLPADVQQLARSVRRSVLAMPRLRSLTIACDGQREDIFNYLEERGL
jgi:hypothetical protein